MIKLRFWKNVVDTPPDHAKQTRHLPWGGGLLVCDKLFDSEANEEVMAEYEPLEAFEEAEEVLDERDWMPRAMQELQRPVVESERPRQPRW